MIGIYNPDDFWQGYDGHTILLRFSMSIWKYLIKSSLKWGTNIYPSVLLLCWNLVKVHQRDLYFPRSLHKGGCLTTSEMAGPRQKLRVSSKFNLYEILEHLIVRWKLFLVTVWILTVPHSLSVTHGHILRITFRLLRVCWPHRDK